MDKRVIGFTGPQGSGKGIAAHHLEKKYGFVYISLSDFLREKSGSDDRKILQDFGNKLREEFGHSVLAGFAGEKIKASDSRLFVVDSIRHPEEIRYLWKHFDAEIYGVNAPLRKLYENFEARAREGDRKTIRTYEDFLLSIKNEQGEEGSSTQQLFRCLSIAKPPVIINDGTIEEFLEKVDLRVNIRHINRERE